MIDPVALTQELVRCKSITPADAGAMDVLVRALEPLGFTCTRLRFGEIENLFARRGNGGPHLAFAGHTDVVPPGDEARWTHPPFAATIADGKIYGRGTADMKANIAAFIAALSATPVPEDGSVSLIITGDEEGPATDGTVRVLEWMAENGHTPDAALVGEPSNPERMGDEIKIGRRGSLTGTLSITGVQGHVAYPHRARNPIPVLARMVESLGATALDSGSDHFEPSSLQVVNLHVGNTADNVIPGAASARFNIRFNDLWTADTLETKIRAVLNRISPDYTLTMTRGAQSFITRPGTLTDLVRDAVRDVTGRTPKLSTGGGTSDARFITRYCPVVECGLINKTIHQFDEHVAIDDLQTLVKIYQTVLNRFYS